ncbi:MAG: endonuclease MutS2 [Myxococcales bacterium]|nr:endonuclease MutS2 [Myxococcales bacterium]
MNEQNTGSPVFHKTAHDLGWNAIQRALAERCAGERARARAEALLPQMEVDEARETIAQVQEARRLREAGSPLPLGEMDELEPALARLDKDGALDGETLLRVALTVANIDRLRRFARNQQELAPRLAAIAADIEDLAHVHEPISHAFDEAGELRDSASADLGRLRRRVRGLHDDITARMKRMLDDPRIEKHLSDRFYTQREERYVLPVRAGSSDKVEGIVLGSSASGQTLFIEPRSIVTLGNQLKMAHMEVAREVLRILAELSGYVADDVEPIRAALEAATRLDLVEARARLADGLDASAPVVDDGDRVQLRAMRHPLMVLAGADVVPSDLLLRRGTVLVISGPNAGGKTVALKTLGLCALMVRAGLHLPVAPGSRLPIYDRVLTDVGDEQSIEKNLSTFTAHMENVIGFLRAATARSLVLLDEIATGTDPGEGEVLAQAILEGFAERGCQVVVTTHYERLKALASVDERFENGSVGFDLAALQPTYRLHLGLPGSSCALDIARRVGLPAVQAERAQVLMGGAESDMAQLLTDLAGQRAELERMQAQARHAEQTASQAKLALDRERRALRERAEREVETLHREAMVELKSARADIARARDALKRRGAERRLVRAADRTVDVAAAAMREHAPAPKADSAESQLLEGEPLELDAIEVGQTVVVSSLASLAEVTAIDRRGRGRVTVQAGPLRTTVSVGDLRRVSGKAARRARRLGASVDATSGGAGAGTGTGASTSTGALPVKSPDITLDARGMRVDEALRAADKFVDQALLAGRDVLYVVHGYGSGALRAALRSHLASSSAVRNLRGGEANEGGDGVTVVWLS